MSTSTTAVVVNRKRGLRAAVASGVAIALLGGGAGFSLLTEEHRANQSIQAGGQMALSVNGDRSGTVILDVADGALPGDVFARDIVIANEGDVPARLSLAAMDGTVNGEDERSDVLDTLVSLSLSGAVSEGFGTISALPELADDVTPQVGGFTVLMPGETADLAAHISVANADLAEWAAATGGSSQVVLRVVGEQVAAEDTGGNPGGDTDGGDMSALSVDLFSNFGEGEAWFVRVGGFDPREPGDENSPTFTITNPTGGTVESNSHSWWFSATEGIAQAVFDIGDEPDSGTWVLSVELDGVTAEFNVIFTDGQPSW